MSVAALCAAIPVLLESGSAAGRTCYHPGIGPGGKVTLVPSECPYPEGGMVAGITSGPSHATLMSTYDLDITYIERTPRYPRYCVKKVSCCECDEGKESTCIHDPTAPFCSDIPEALGPSCDPVIATGACQPLVVDAAHPQGKRWPDPGDSVTGNVPDPVELIF